MKKRYLVFIQQKGSKEMFNGVIPTTYFRTKEIAIIEAKEFWKKADIEKIYIQEIYLGELEEVK